MAAAARLLESLGHHVEESAPAAMFEPEFVRHFGTIIAADTEATFQAFEMLLGRPIGEDEIEPRNVGYRQVRREPWPPWHICGAGRGSGCGRGGWRTGGTATTCW